MSEHEGAPASSCEAYLRRLPLMAEQRCELARNACARGDTREAMARVHRSLAGAALDPENPAYGSIRQRLGLAYGGAGAAAPATGEARARVRLVTTPPLNRSTMVPPPWTPFGLLGLRARQPRGAACPESPDPRGRWHAAATVRRVLLFVLIASQTLVATYFMTSVLPYHGRQPLEIAILALFAVLFSWISAGFWTAVLGFLVLLGGGDRHAISRAAASEDAIDADARTAVIMPICNENVPRVFAGLRATYLSLAKTRELERFDFFVLSDSSDADARVAETEAWLELSRELGAAGRLFYRWRRHRIKRKSGNVADFCRRWGRNYRYMVVLDADSVMTGDCLVTLVRLMEANPNAGIIQTAPRAAGRDTLYARMQQFATRVYGPLFTAGLHFWQLGESHYWGHNAVIRVAPFMRHCALGRLRGRGGLSEEILSHDFVEAALMRRAGWAVWIAYDLPGSYEEMPPNLVDELKRDRRWCQGNLINSRLFLAEGLHPAHRVVFMTGVMAYLSAPLWFLFLLLSTALLAVHTLIPPTYFQQPGQLFPLWPEWHLEWAVGLFTATALLLYLPKILAVALVWAKGGARYGGAVRLCSGMFAELFFSALLAPIRMLFHTQFVASALTGWSVQWKSPPREDAETTWGEALRRHGWHSLLGLAWAGGVYWLNPSFLWWLAPIVGALLLSIPISVYTSRVSLGQRLRQAGVFLIPEEVRPPPELLVAHARGRGMAPGFVEAVVDPVTNALACAAGAPRARRSEAAREQRLALVERALVESPEALSAREKMRFLSDSLALARLHFEVWTRPDAHSAWREAQARRGGGKIAWLPGALSWNALKRPPRPRLGPERRGARRAPAAQHTSLRRHSDRAGVPLRDD
jgi:membrane glycosyltransferase